MTTALEPAGEHRLAIAETETQDLADLIEANLGEAGFTPQDLDRVKVPAGGATIWSVPGIDGEAHTPELIGVVAHWHARKAYWAKSVEDGGGGSAPDCYSEDLKQGIGDPGIACAKCPFNQFGSAAKGEGKACKDMIQLFMVRGDDLLPTVVNVPASSIANVRQYFLRLVGRKTPYYGAVTKLALQATRSKSGVAYSEIVPSLVRVLSEEETARVKRYHEAIAGAAASVPIEDSEAGPSGDADYWRRTAMSRYQDAGGDPSDQGTSRAEFAAILGCDPGRSRSEYSTEEWAEIAIHYSGSPIHDSAAPSEDGGSADESLFASEPAAPKGRARKAVEAGEAGTFAQSRGL